MRVRRAESEVQRIVVRVIVPVLVIVSVVVSVAVHGAVGMDVNVRMVAARAVRVSVRMRRIVGMRMTVHRAVGVDVLVDRFAFDLRGTGAAAAGRTHGRFPFKRLRVP